RCFDIAQNRLRRRLVQADRLVDHEPESRKSLVDLRAFDSALQQTPEIRDVRGRRRPGLPRRQVDVQGRDVQGRDVQGRDVQGQYVQCRLEWDEHLLECGLFVEHDVFVD